MKSEQTLAAEIPATIRRLAESRGLCALEFLLHQGPRSADHPSINGVKFNANRS
jgi:hypothetical protein